jgi:hypothetical protein
MKNISDEIVKKLETHILCSITLFLKPCRLWKKVEKFCRAEQPTDDNMSHAHCMLDTQGYKYTHSLCNNYCFYTATMVARSTSTLPYTYIAGRQFLNLFSQFHVQATRIVHWTGSCNCLAKCLGSLEQWQIFTIKIEKCFPGSQPHFSTYIGLNCFVQQCVAHGCVGVRVCGGGSISVSS